MSSTTRSHGVADVIPDEGAGVADYLPLALLVYAATGLVVATVGLNSDDMFGLAHFLGFLGDILVWPLTLLGIL